MAAARHFLSLPCFLAAALLARAEPDGLQDRVQLADGLFRRSLFDLAAKEYAEIAKLPHVQGLDTVLFRLAECYRRINRFADARTTYLQLIDKFPGSPHIPRARLQCALLQLDNGTDGAAKALPLLEPLAADSSNPDVRAAALYHLARALEKLNRPDDALARYGQLRTLFPNSDYALYSGLETAWLLSRSETPGIRRQAMGLYLELIHQKKDAKISEEALYFAALLALKDKRYEESASLFQMLRTHFPHSPRLSASALSAARVHYLSGQYVQAAELLDKILAIPASPDRAEALYLKANCLRQMEQADGAIACYDNLRAEFPDSSLAGDAWHEELTTLYKAGKYAEALKLAELKNPPPEKIADTVYWICAESAMACDRPDAVVQNCKLIVEKYPKSPFAKDALYRLGWLLNKQKAWESAASWFLQVAARFPDDPLAAKSLYSAGVCHARLGRRDVALRDWTDLLTRYPDAPEAAETLYQKAMEELRGKEYRAAAATLDERLRRFPKDARKAETLYWRAAVYRQLNDLAAAEKTFRDCLAAKPSTEIEREAILELGIILHQLNREPEAAALFERLMDSSVAEKMGEARLAWLSGFQFKQNHLDSAAKAAQILIDIKPDKGWLQTGWTLLGRVHRAKNERDAAIHAFEEALKTGASTDYAAEAALRLGELLSEAGRFDDASAHLEDAAKRASAPDKTALRAHAYMGLAKNAERRGSDEEALRYYISVGILFDDAELVPEALAKSAVFLDKLGRPAEAKAMREELKTRYPDSPQARKSPIPPTGCDGKDPA